MFCPHCGTRNPEDSPTCSACQKPLPRLAPPTTQGPVPPGVPDSLAYVVPINTDPVAIIAGYLGLFSLFFGIVLGPIAILVGALSLNRLRTRPGVHGKSRAWTAIILGALSFALWGLIFWSSLL